MTETHHSIVPSTGPLEAAESAIASTVHLAATRLVDLVVRSYFEQFNSSFLLTFDLNKVKDDPQVVSDIAGPMTIQLPF